MKQLLTRLTRDYPDLQFKPGTQFLWSPSQQVIYYSTDRTDESSIWSLLHELGHATLGHTDFKNDFSLLQMEADAWEQAVVIAKQYDHYIDEDHIQDCLDTYRDWLHQRSTCPTCGATSLQTDAHTYQCFNCQQTWHVAQNRHCRPYRLTGKQKQPV